MVIIQLSVALDCDKAGVLYIRSGMDKMEFNKRYKYGLKFALRDNGYFGVSVNGDE